FCHLVEAPAAAWICPVPLHDALPIFIATSAAHAPGTMREAAEMGIRYVWMHRSFGAGSVSEDATRIGRDAGILVIDGGCPLMFGDRESTRLNSSHVKIPYAVFGLTKE